MKSIVIVIVCLLSTVSTESDGQTLSRVSDLLQAPKTTRVPDGSRKPVQLTVNQKSCGKQFTRSFNEKIVGGRDATPGEFPWQASLQLRRGSSWFHFCGGSLINNQYIVTAAHCCQNLNTADFRVVLGAFNLKSLTGFEVITTASRVINHERYNPDLMTNDIALIKLSKLVDLSAKSGSPVNSICLPTSQTTNSPAEGDELQVSGWGRLSEGGAVPDKLQVVGVPFMSIKECNKYYPGQIKKGMLCAGNQKGGKDACQGDSGGPIVKCKPDDHCTLAGIVSWGYGCARPNNPGVYTDTKHYTDWIKDKISKTRSVF